MPRSSPGVDLPGSSVGGATGGSIWSTRGKYPVNAAGFGGWTKGLIASCSGRQSTSRSSWQFSTVGGSRLPPARDGVRTGHDILDLSDRKLGLKHLARREDGSLKSSLGSIRPSRQSDLAGADLKFFQLHVLALDVRRIAHHDDGIAILASPLDVNATHSRVLDDSVEHIVGRYRQGYPPGFSRESTRPCSPREHEDEPRQYDDRFETRRRS